MAKITRKRLTRGARLKPGHVSTPLEDAALVFSGTDVESEQMAAPMAPFCVNLTLPYLGHEPYGGAKHSVPFTLPPLQEFFQLDSSGAPFYMPDLPPVKLRAVSFSFDQRAEPAAIASHLWTFSDEGSTGRYGYSSEQGKLYFEGVSRLMVRLSIREKSPAIFAGTPPYDYPYVPSKELWSTTLPASAFAGDALRANPFLQTGIDVAVNPYSTLIFTMECPGLEDMGDAGGSDELDAHLVLPSIEVSIKFASTLVTRDVGPNIQNIPADGGSGKNEYGTKTGPTVTITAPAAASKIEADTADGVCANITVIDDQFWEKLEGGYNKYADTPPTETIKDDAAYDVIAVPLFQGSAHGGIACHPTYLSTWPYMGSVTDLTSDDWAMNAASVFDRRIVPIHHSYTLHHAILAWNWTPWRVLGYTPDTDVAPPISESGGEFNYNLQGAYTIPPSTYIHLECQVGIGTGIRADNFNYESVAGLAISAPSGTGLETYPSGWGEGTTLIDRINTSSSPPGGWMGLDAGGAPGEDHTAVAMWNWELHQLEPRANDSDGPGYHGNSEPIFMGPGWSTTQERTDIGSSPAAPRTEGAEQWIEVRCAVKSTDSSGGAGEEYTIPHATTFFDGGGLLRNRASMVVGYGGCYVYLICKKTLTR